MNNDDEETDIIMMNGGFIGFIAPFSNRLSLEYSVELQPGTEKINISAIVEDKKTNSQSAEIQYLPQNMLKILKIISSKTFRLAKNVVEQVLGLNILSQTLQEVQSPIAIEPQAVPEILTQIAVETQVVPLENLANDMLNISNSVQNDLNNNEEKNVIPENTVVSQTDDIIIDYRARFFEEQEKNKELEEQIKILTEKLDSIRVMIG